MSTSRSITMLDARARRRSRHRNFTAALLATALAAGAVAMGDPAGAASGNVKYAFTLRAVNVVPPTADPRTAAVTVLVKPKTSQVCVLIKKLGVNESPVPAGSVPTAAHVHQGTVGTNGPTVLTLNRPVLKGKKYQQSKTCAIVGSALLTGLRTAPTQYYVDVHTGSYPGGAVRGQLGGASAADRDGDRLTNSAETNTGVYVSTTNTGTNPDAADTDGDGINDGDETLGTASGLNLPAMGTRGVKRNILLEFDWFADAITCGSHSHQPTAAQISAYETAFASANVPNPDGTTGIRVISDYGQGGAFTGGNFVADPDGVVAGGVTSAEFRNYKAANFAARRNGYFHYVLLPHRYNTNSLSSGQAEINGDDLIVSLQCYLGTSDVANTIMHELGHNLGLRHGGNVDVPNWKPNYNSVMNYKYQFPGVDNNCTPAGDGILDYSYGTRITLNENNLDENLGICGAPAVDWNNSATITAGVVADINRTDVNAADGLFQVLTDFNDWTHLYFAGIADSSGNNAGLRPVEVVTEQPHPGR